jgi:UPF0716 protein FxsA
MFLKLFLAFTLIPMIELYLLIKLGAVIGAFNTLLLVILTGATGAYLARLQGLQVMFRVRERLQQGEMPAEDMLDALIILIAGIVLLTPGLLTDIAGLLLLLPSIRFRFKVWLRQKLDLWTQNRKISIGRYP